MRGKNPFIVRFCYKNVDFLTILAIILPVSGAACFIARLALNPNQIDQKMTQKHLKYIKELEDDNKYLEGMLKRSKVGPKLDESMLDDPKNAILSLATQFEGLLPAKLKPLLRDPKLLNIALDFYKKDPEKAKQLLSQFVGKGKMQGNADTIQIGQHKFAASDAL